MKQIKYQYHNSHDKPKVRFSPSPTGNPHVGLIRTALFNWLYALSNNGKFVLRIEDTDQTRSVKTSYDQLIESLQWLGIQWHEGVEIGGPNGPYKQSQRTHIYKYILDKLIKKKYVYKCYVPTLKERDTSQNNSFVFKFKMSNTNIIVRDLIKGKIIFRDKNIEDFIVTRGDQSPLYNFVNPIDDALMKITHVIRGEDLLSSTPKQIAIHKALIDIGISKFIPYFAHLPHVLSDTNKKISKRDIERSSQYNFLWYIKEGFIPEGVINYLSLLGWSLHKNKDFFLLKDAIKNFNIKSVLTHSARFDINKAKAINAKHIRSLPKKIFFKKVLEFFKKYYEDELCKKLKNKNVRDLIYSTQTRIKTLKEVKSLINFLLLKDKAIISKTIVKESIEEVNLLNFCKIILVSVLKKINNWNNVNLEKIISYLLISNNKSQYKNNILNLLRLSNTGQKISPPIYKCMSALGKRRCIKRINYYLHLKNNN